LLQCSIAAYVCHPSPDGYQRMIVFSTPMGGTLLI
jgi:hypothetical protein